MSDHHGFILTATGPTYRRALLQALASLRAHHPDAEIDIYVDTPMDAPDATQVHLLPNDAQGQRPKFHAMRHTRFEHVIFLDVDIMVVAPMDDVFEVLERFDIVAVHDQMRNSHFGRLQLDDDIPNAFPQVNTGVLGLRRSARTLKLLDDWEAGYLRTAEHKDQPALRQVLWRNPDIRLAVMPPEYNLWDLRLLDRFSLEYHTAPRMLHHYHFMQPKILSRTGGKIEAVLGKPRAYWLQMLLSRDRTLAAMAGQRVAPSGSRWGYVAAVLRHLPESFRAKLRRILDIARRRA